MNQLNKSAGRFIVDLFKICRSPGTRAKLAKYTNNTGKGILMRFPEYFWQLNIFERPFLLKIDDKASFVKKKLH